VGSMRQMNEDNQQLHWLQRKVVKQEQRSKVIEQSFDVVSKRLRDSVKSVDLVRERTRKHHEETKEEVCNKNSSRLIFAFFVIICWYQCFA
jgi:GH35 family endo-1,4-beta-xylanase